MNSFLSMIEIRECLFKKPLDFAPGFANIVDLIRGGGECWVTGGAAGGMKSCLGYPKSSCCAVT